jgi:Lrp/AsnC family transcriptional regulator for asnA, asnC and gidA
VGRRRAPWDEELIADELSSDGPVFLRNVGPSPLSKRVLDTAALPDHNIRNNSSGMMRKMLSLDRLDAEIITLLQSDGRRPTVEIARRLAVAEGTVRKRIERLSREKIIQISAWADPLKIGYQNYAVLMIHVELRELERAAVQLSKMPEIFFLGTCTGAFDIFVSACFRSLEHMHEFMTKRLSRVPGIQRVATSNVTRVMKRDYSFHVTTADGEAPGRSGRVRRLRSGGTTSDKRRSRLG